MVQTLSVLHIFFKFNFHTTLLGGHHYYPLFTEEETETLERYGGLPRLHS